MPDSHLSPSQQVERIREILVGRQMEVIEERVERLERLFGSSQPAYPSPFPSEETPHTPGSSQADDQTVTALRSALTGLEDKLASTTSRLAEHEQLLTKDLGSSVADLNNTLADRIDRRVREILDLIETELDSLKQKLTHDLARIEEEKADRLELHTRFDRLAKAAANQDSSLEPKEGFSP